MTIYVDPIYDYGRRGKWCHMATDGDINDLHAIANAIGLKRAWFQDNPLHPHYDLTPGKRELAVKLGAVEVDRQELVKRISKFFEETR